MITTKELESEVDKIRKMSQKELIGRMVADMNDREELNTLIHKSMISMLDMICELDRRLEAIENR